MLILKTAEESATAAADLLRIEREVLVFGEAQVDGRELGEPGGATVFPPTASHPCQSRRLVPYTDLAQFDPGPELRSEVPDQGPKIHSFLGGKIDRQLVPVPLPFGVAHLHRQLMLFHLLNHFVPDVLLRFPKIIGDPNLLLRGAAHDGENLRRFRFTGRAAGAAAGAFLGGGLTVAFTRPKSKPRSASTITGSCSRSGSSSVDHVKKALRLPLNRTSRVCI